VCRRGIKQSHDRVPNVFVDKGVVPYKDIAGHPQKGIDHLVGPFRAEVVCQFGERRKVGKNHGDLDHMTLLNMSTAPAAKARIARATRDSDCPEGKAPGARQRYATNCALRGEDGITIGPDRG
jgi:hypothetical protein